MVKVQWNKIIIKGVYRPYILYGIGEKVENPKSPGKIYKNVKGFDVRKIFKFIYLVTNIK